MRSKQIQAELDNPELSGMRDMVKSYILENKEILSLRKISSMLTTDGQPDGNFQQMIDGSRRMPENYVRNLHAYLSGKFRDFGGDAPVETERATAKIETPKGALIFRKESENMFIEGLGLNCKIGKRSTDIELNGKVVTDAPFIMRVSGASVSVEKLIDLLNK